MNYSNSENIVSNKDDMRIIRAMAAILIPLLFFLVVGVKIGFVFEANDDRIISDMLSGTLMGTPSFHCVYVNFWISYPLSLLYGINRSVPWWGGMLLLFMLISHVIVVYYGSGYVFDSLSERRSEIEKRNRKDLILSLAIMGLLDLGLVGLSFYVVALTQFTAVAILLAAAGYVAFILGNDKKGAFALFVVAEFIAFCIRYKGMFLVQPFGVIFVCAMMLADKKIVLKRAIRLFASLAAILLVGFSGRLVAGEIGPEWDKFAAITLMTEELTDFEGTPEYSDIRKTAEKYGVSEAEWNAFADLCIVDLDWSVDFDKEMIAYAHNHERTRPADSEVGMKRRIIKVTVAFIIPLLCILLRKKYRLLIPLGGLLFAHCVVWWYMFSRGRMQLRVNVPLMVSEWIFILLLACFAYFDSSQTNKSDRLHSQATALLFCAIAFAAFGVFSGYREYKYFGNGQDYDVQLLLLDSVAEIEKYCNSNNDKKFIIDLDCHVNSRGLPLYNRAYSGSNFAQICGWHIGTPEYSKWFKEYMKGAECFYYIVPEYETSSRIDSKTGNYLKERAGCEPILEDYISAPTGGRFLVYRFDGGLY